jgi:hypothetical protein
MVVESMIPPVWLAKSAKRRERAKRSSASPEARATDDFLYTEGRTLDLGRSDEGGVGETFANRPKFCVITLN